MLQQGSGFDHSPPMSTRRRFALLVGVMFSVVSLSTIILLTFLIRHNFRQMEAQLLGNVQRQVTLLETITEYNVSLAELIQDEDPSYDPYEASLLQILAAHANIDDLGQSVEYILAKQEADSIIFLYQSSAATTRLPALPVSDPRVESQRRALEGEFGSHVGPDYHGAEVLSAYGYLKPLRLAVVIKMDMAEIRAPIYGAASRGIAVTVFIILIGSFVFVKFGSHVLVPLRDHNARLQSEIEVRKSIEHKLQLTVDTLNQSQKIAKLGSWYLDVATNEVTWTEELYRMYGFDAALPPPPYTEHKKLFTEESWNMLSTALAKTAEQGIPYELELETLRDDGTHGWMWVYGESVRNPEGKIVGLRGAAQDISRRKADEQRLIESEEKFRSLFESMAESYALHKIIIDQNNTPINYIFVDVNKAFTEQFGMHPEDILGQKVTDIIPGIENDPADWIGMYGKIAQTGEQQAFDQYSAALDKWFSVIAFSPMPDYFATLFMEITDRKNAEQELKTSEALLRSMANNFPNSYVSIIEKDLTVGFSGGQEFKRQNLDPDQFVGLTLKDVFGEHADFITEQYKRTFKGEERVFKLYLNNQYQVYRTIPLVDAEGNIPRILACVENVTEQKHNEKVRQELESQLRQSQKLETVGTMVGGVSHELNNILQSMFLYRELIEEELPDAKNIKENFNQFVSGAEKARDIVKQILTFSRKHDVVMQPQPIDGLVLETLRLVKSTLPSNIELIQHIEPTPAKVLCDNTQISQIILNLTNNAKHAMRDHGGRLTIALQQTHSLPNTGEAEREVIELSVQDTGHGIDPAVLDRIFDPFFTTKPLGSGTGLGLSVIHGIVKVIGGEIAVSSQPKAGTTFTIHFPVHDAPATDSLSVEAGEEQPRFHSVLLVDDVTNIRQGMQSALIQKGFKVDCAENGEQALALFKAGPHKYDLVITDQSMPSMSGLELAREIRSLNSKVRIILSTGNFDIGSNVDLGEFGVSSCIRKPWSIQELIQKMNAMEGA